MAGTPGLPPPALGPSPNGSGPPGVPPGLPGRAAPGNSRPSLRKALVVFENRTYRLLWASSLTSLTGMQMQQVARAFLAWELTHSFTAVGLVNLSFGLPMLTFSLLGGAVADRLNKRNLSLMTQIATGTLALVTAFLIVVDLISIEILFAVGLVQGTFVAFGMPARSPLMALVVGSEQLTSAMAMSNAAMNATRLSGPAIAGILIGLQGVESAYFVQSALYVVSVILLLVVPSVHGRPQPARRASMVREVGIGLRYATSDPKIRMLLMLAFITALFAMPYITLLPGFVEEDLGRGGGTFGMLQAVTGAGALIGSLLVATFTEFPRKPLLQLVAGLLGAGGLVLLGVGAIAFGLAGAIAASLFLGLVLTSYQTLNQTLLIGAARPEYYGRIMSMMMLTFSTMPLMAVPLGILADRWGATTVFMVQGLLVTVALLAVTMTNRSYTFGTDGIASGSTAGAGSDPAASPPQPGTTALTNRE